MALEPCPPRRPRPSAEAEETASQRRSYRPCRSPPPIRTTPTGTHRLGCPWSVVGTAPCLLKPQCRELHTTSDQRACSPCRRSTPWIFDKVFYKPHLGLVPIATGEHEFTRYGFQQLLEAGAADVLQPDVHRVGGITELRRVCQMASGSGIEVIPHVYSAATLHVVLSQPNCGWIEHLTNPSYWGDGQRVDALFLGEPEVLDGAPALPTAPGIGVRVNPEAMPELADWQE
ncbi:enolase C-terminal domain-like protein [Streptomyces sp. NPDC088124]|uniref:enolase C-terminal domain-like protein n=1 Tax=Streptomyces sp. NPDC088124 TaxID=3154654 RepID=UPI003429F4CC